MLVAAGPIADNGHAYKTKVIATMASLQEQLLKAGMVDAKKAKQINKEKRKQAKQQPKGQQQQDETKAAAAAALVQKAEHDRALERERQAQLNKRAIAAQIKQLITSNNIERRGGNVAFSFADNKKIKTIHISPLLQTQLAKGVIAIAGLDGGYHLIPAMVADKISQRDTNTVVYRNIPSADTPDEDDPYADYQIPDDLMW